MTEETKLKIEALDRRANLIYQECEEMRQEIRLMEDEIEEIDEEISELKKTLKD